MQDEPIPPRLRSEFSVPPTLDALIMECLAKDPAVRPASAAVLSERLAATVRADAWTFDSAHAWWEQHRPLTQMQARVAGAAVEDGTFTGIVRPGSRSRLEAKEAFR